MNLTKTATYWTMAISAVLILGMGSTFAQESLHICEELMRQEHTEAEMELCIKEFGEPESFRQARESRREEQRVREATEEERKKFYDKTFTSAELKRFGAPYVARRNYYDLNGRIYKRKTLTDAKDLCKYLGFDKNLTEGMLSEEMDDFANRNFVGVVVSDPLFGSLEAKQFRFQSDELDPSNIQVYTALTCRRDRKEGDPENSVINSVNAVNEEIRNSQTRQNDQEVREDNSSRRETRTLEEDSPYIYRRANQSSQR